MSYPSTNDLQGDLKAAVVNLLYRLADDDLVLGHRNSEWTGLGPILEADIAFSSMAQDLMGHALTFYELLHKLSEPSPDAIVYARAMEDFRCCSLVSLPNGDWAFSSIRQFLFGEAKAVRLDALAGSAFEPMAHIARKLRGEVKYHTMHGRMWLDKLGDATDESHKRMQSALDELFPHALGMFEAIPCEAILQQERIVPAESQLCERWQGIVGPLLKDAGLATPTAPEPVLGGRTGNHPEPLAQVLGDMRKVYQLDPAASW